MKSFKLLFFILLFTTLALSQYGDDRDFYDSPESFVTDQESIITKEKEDVQNLNPYEHGHLEVSSDMASYLHLTKVEKLRVGVPVNLLFIGFEGDGDHFLYFNDYEFYQYFEHVEHHLKHLVVPVGEEQTTTLKVETPKTHVQFDIGWNIVKLHPLVNAIVEDTILWHLRPENNRPNTTKRGIPRQSRPDQKLEEQEFFYVDVFKFSTLLNNLLHYLNLTESYSVIIMNPKNPLQFPDLQTYGYRSGFSDEEMRVLQLSEKFMQKKILVKPPPKIRKHSQEKFERKYVFGTSANRGKDGRGGVSLTDHYVESENWAKWYLEAQKGNWSETKCGGGKRKKRAQEAQVEEGDERAEDVEARMSEEEKDEEDWTCLFSERRALHSGKRGVEEQAMELAESGTHFEQKYLSVIQESGWHIFNYSRIQLANKMRSAAFQWDQDNKNLTLNETEKAVKKNASLTDFARQNIQEEMIWTMNAYGLHEDCLVDNWISHERFAFIDLTAGPFDWGPIVSGEGVRSRFSLPQVPHRTMNDVPHEAKAKATELEIVRKTFWEKCVRYYRVENETAECQALHNRVIQLHQELHPIIKMNKEQLNEYIEGERVQTEHQKLTEEEVSAEEKSKVLQKFTSHLNNVISSSIRHLFVPPVPLYPPIYATRVIFNFFLITNHNSYNPFDTHHFNYEQFKQEVLKLKQPQQEFVFSLHRISLKRDRDLHVAFTNSLKHVVIPKLTLKGEFIPVTQTYLDTRELRHELRLKNITLGRQHYNAEDDTNEKDQRKTKKTAKQAIKEKLLNNDPLDHEFHQEGEQIHQVYREIPIFFFSMSNFMPILVDKYYQSKALKDLVVVVQSRTRTVESRLACNGKVIYWNLANPMKSVLSSVSLILAGLIPSHISYSEPRQAAEQNWLWSVGDNPFSYTSAKSHFSDTHRDLVARNYALHALEKSISKVNKVIDQLKSVSILETKPLLNNTTFQEKLGTYNLLSHYTRLEHLWTGVVIALEQLHYSEAVHNIPELEEATQNFLQDCKTLVSELHVLSCEMKGRSTTDSSLFSHLDWWLVTCVLFDLVVVAVVLIIRGRKFKAKTN